MELNLKRAYFQQGTNGGIFRDEQFICFTIELPWKENLQNVSCIPEGRYLLAKRFTQKRDWHLIVKSVSGRTGILFHPANDALKELQGCIAPVTLLSGIGTGTDSRKATIELNELVFQALDADEAVYLTIQKAVL